MACSASLAVQYPKLAQQWDKERNKGRRTPDELQKSDLVNIWWKCPKGHSFLKSPMYRSVDGLYDCPICSASNFEKFGYKILDGMKVEYECEHIPVNSPVCFRYDIYICPLIIC